MQRNSGSRTLAFLLAICGACSAWAQETAVIAPASEAAEGLDLRAVGELFRNAPNAEAFERDLNDPKKGVNNLDLDDNGDVDYIRVVDQATGDTHVLILQVPLSETEFQDVATIEVEKSKNKTYEVQLHGNEQIYGVDYYVRPAGVVWASVAFIGWLYSPVYRPYRSVYYYGYYPPYWRPWRPVSVSVYRTNSLHIHRHVTYHVTKTNRVVSARSVYRPSTSVLVVKPLRNPTSAQREYQVKRKTTVTGPGGGEVTRKKTTVSGPGGAEVSRTKTQVTTADGKEAKKTKTQVTTPSGNSKTVTKTKTKKTKTKKTKTKKTKSGKQKKNE